MTKRLVPLVAVVVLVSLTLCEPRKPIHVETFVPIDIKKYEDWSVDDVRPGMSLAEATEACGKSELLARVDYFGTVYKLYDGRALNWMRSGHFVVNESDQVICVEGYELKHRGKVLEDYLASIKSMDTLIADECCISPPWLHCHKFRSPIDPIVVRGVYFETYILGNEPGWLSLCYRQDELGDCLENLSHLQRTFADFERDEMRRFKTIEEFHDYAGEEFVGRLRCPLGGVYRLSDHTLTCFSHAEGPISLTRNGKNSRFWQGAPE